MAKVEQLESRKIPGGARHPVHRNPVPHIRRKTQEPLKTWSGSYQPLPMPRLIFSPYVGCSAGCEFCFIQGFPGLYHMAETEETLTVFTNYPDHVKEQLSRLRVAPPAVLSPFTDPFQPINDRYELSERLVKECVMAGLPLDIVTRYHVPDEVVAMLKHLPSARIQVSVDPYQREGDVPYYVERLDMLERISEVGVDVALRLDPLFPPVDKIGESVEPIIGEAVDRGIEHLVVGFGQVPSVLYEDFVSGREDSYRQKSPGAGWWSPVPSVKKSMLEIIKSMCESFRATMGVLGESDLQDEFGDFESPFRQMLPVVHRRSGEEPFVPLDDCPGDCLRCPKAVCEIPELRGDLEAHRNLSTKQWDEWGQTRQQESLIQ